MDGGATAAEEGTPPLEASSLPRLRAELAAMKKRAVFKRAEELGVPESDLEEADEAADPKAAAIALILAHARLRAELAAMKKRAVFKRAEELGVPEADLEEADEAADPKAAAIALILELPSAPEPEPEELAAAEVRREKHSLGDVASSPAAVDVAGAASWTVSPPPSTQMADFASAVCIFGSMRFPVPDEARVLCAALRAAGVHLKIVDMKAGQDIDREVYSWIEHCDTFFVFGSKSYGEDTGNSACTYNEVKFAQAKQKRIILLRMIPWEQEFDELQARVLFNRNMLTLEWQQGQPMAPDLPGEILKALDLSSHELAPEQLDAASMSVKDLKAELSAKGGDFSGCFEKSELVQLLKAASAPAAGPAALRTAFSAGSLTAAGRSTFSGMGPPARILVEGAGSNEVNLMYIRDGEHEGKPKWSACFCPKGHRHHETSKRTIYYWESSGHGRWYILRWATCLAGGKLGALGRTLNGSAGDDQRYRSVSRDLELPPVDAAEWMQVDNYGAEPPCPRLTLLGPCASCGGSAHSLRQGCCDQLLDGEPKAVVKEATGGAAAAAAAEPGPQVCALGLEKLPDEMERVYRDTHRVVLKAKAPHSGYVHVVRLRLHELPAGPADGSGWDVCSYSTLDGDMGEKQGYLSEERRQPIRVGRVLAAEQVVKVTPPLWIEEGQYVGIQNRSSDFCAGWEASWGPGGTGGMCLSLDDHSDHGQYLWKFEGGMASEPDSRLLKTTGRLKERHVGFCAILTAGESQ